MAARLRDREEYQRHLRLTSEMCSASTAFPARAVIEARRAAFAATSLSGSLAVNAFSPSGRNSHSL